MLPPTTIQANDNNTDDNTLWVWNETASNFGIMTREKQGYNYLQITWVSNPPSDGVMIKILVIEQPYKCNL